MSNAIQNRVDVVKDIVIRDAYHAIAERFEIGLTRPILLPTGDVAIAVHFYDEFCVAAAKINDVAINRVLPAEAAAMDLTSA